MSNEQLIFEFSAYYFDVKQKEALFVYRILDGDQELHIFEETLFFSTEMQESVSAQALDNLLHMVHLMLGISYWKLYCPSQMRILTRPLSKPQADFWNTVYTKGLGEFFYKNQINFQNLVKFPYQESALWQPVEIFTDDYSLLGIGGGKDSIVAGELLKQAHKPFDALIVQTQKEHEVSNQVIEKMQVDTLRVQRQIDPILFELNTQKHSYNGHIPISAVFAAVGVLTAALYGYKNVIVGNERSANSENLRWNGQDINHQWSKSVEFEHLFQDYLKQFVTPSINYFSLLRPYSEYTITQIFSKYTAYFPIFSSCNRNFKVHESKNLGNKVWCGTCPKCVFVFTMLAVFLDKSTLLSFFHKNLFEDKNLLPIFEEMLGLTGKKPFECVGTFEEMQLAVANIIQDSAFADEVIIRHLQEKWYSQQPKNIIAQLEKTISHIDTPSNMPEEFGEIINQFNIA